MAPIHESDLDENRGSDSSRFSSRWAKEEWKDYELWEETDARARRKKRIWIALTALLFLALLAVPVWKERSPFWSANRASMRLARELSLVKKEAALSGVAIRVTIEPGLRLKKEWMESCAPTSPIERTDWVEIRPPSVGLDWLPLERAVEWSVPSVIEKFCYDPRLGTAESGNLAIIPVNDLASGRSDRVSILQLAGSGADLTIQ